MKTKKTNTLTVLMAIAVGASFWLGARTAYADDIYVTKAGSPDPDGSSVKPYQMVEAGIFRAKSLPGSTVLIEGGKKYYETLTVNTPCTLTATGGTATIGKMDYQASTTLDIITLNTHLAGDQAFMPSWFDCERGEDIADQLKAMPDKPDVVAFQEIWDDDLFLGGDCVGEGGRGIYKEAGYLYGRHGTGIDCIGCANSGLAIMSQHPMPIWMQFFWGSAADDYCNGIDCMASKGWVMTEFEKDGFNIWIANLHTDAGESLGDRQARKNQLTKLRSFLITLRQYFPSHVLFVMGDFNIYDHKDQYRKFLINLLGDEEAGGRDADRNSPGFIFDSSYQDTCSTANPLAIHWDPDEKGGRLDYIFYFPSYDGSVEVLPMYVDVLPFTGHVIPAICDPMGINCLTTTNYSSDHWSVYGKFKLIRK